MTVAATTYTYYPRGIMQPFRPSMDMGTCWGCGAFFELTNKYRRVCDDCILLKLKDDLEKTIIGELYRKEDSK